MARAKKRLKRSRANAMARFTLLPQISFVIPVYDRTDWVRDAISSALNQTLPNVEVVVICDGSPEETREVVNSFRSDPRVRVFEYPVASGSAVRGRNKGILESRGEYVSFLDSDDVALPNRAELTLSTFMATQADVVYGEWIAILEGTRTVSDLTDGQLVATRRLSPRDLYLGDVPCQSTVTIRRSLIAQSGYLKPELRYREDHELWARLAFFGARFCPVPAPLAKLRLHSGNNELNHLKDSHHWLSVVQQSYTQRGPVVKKIVFLVPGLGISGGIAVVMHHASMLMDEGHDVSVVNLGAPGNLTWIPIDQVPVIDLVNCKDYHLENIDLLFATGWSTAPWLERIDARRKLYFVQADERRFYEDPGMQAEVGETYRLDVEYLTQARWIQEWLAEDFGHIAHYVPNGIDLELFRTEIEPLEPKGAKRRVLIEGPIDIPFKSVAEAYSAVAELDCEIWLVSSSGRPPKDWRVDRFYEKVPFVRMPQMYASCDIFLKLSRVEGFGGPPLEAMACGCAVVVGDVIGASEYAIHEQNALVVPLGDVAAARAAVDRLLGDDELRSRLVRGGLETSSGWPWSRSRGALLQVIDD